MIKPIELPPIPSVFESLIAYERGLVDGLQAELGWSDEGSFGEKSLRIIVLETACAARMEDCLATAEDKFARWMDQGCNSIDILDGLNPSLNTSLNHRPIWRLPKRVLNPCLN